MYIIIINKNASAKKTVLNYIEQFTEKFNYAEFLYDKAIEYQYLGNLACC